MSDAFEREECRIIVTALDAYAAILKRQLNKETNSDIIVVRERELIKIEQIARHFR